MFPKSWQGKPWVMYLVGGVFALVIVPQVIGALPDIWEESGASDTARSAGRGAGSAARGAGGYAHDAGSSAASGFSAVFPKLLLVIGVIVGLIVLFKVIGNRRSGGSGRNGQTALRQAQRDEQQAISDVRLRGQQAVHQAQVEAQQRRDEALRLAHQWVANEQDRWV